MMPSGTGDTSLWGVPLIVIVAVIAAAAVVIGHYVTRSNAKLQAEIADKTSALSNEQSRANAALNAKLTATIKLAELRQAWINTLRQEMVEFHRLNDPTMTTRDRKRLNAIHASGTKIELSLNPADPDYNTLRTSMFEMYQNTEAGIIAEKVSDSYVQVCQAILKREWDRLQGDINLVTSSGLTSLPNAVGPATPGEPWYRRTG